MLPNFVSLIAPSGLVYARLPLTGWDVGNSGKPHCLGVFSSLLEVFASSVLSHEAGTTIVGFLICLSLLQHITPAALVLEKTRGMTRGSLRFRWCRPLCCWLKIHSLCPPESTRVNFMRNSFTRITYLYGVSTIFDQQALPCYFISSFLFLWIPSRGRRNSEQS